VSSLESYHKDKESSQNGTDGKSKSINNRVNQPRIRINQGCNQYFIYSAAVETMAQEGIDAGGMPLRSSTKLGPTQDKKELTVTLY
jgi:hypothetical protein